MSIFQCTHCGCAENTALTNAYHTMSWVEEKPHVAASYREVLGLKPGEPFGKYCSACTPVWFTDKGDYGIGPNPSPSTDKFDGGGIWHGRFSRMFLPLGEFETNRVGNLQKKGTQDDGVRKWALLVTKEITGRISAAEVLELVAKRKDKPGEPHPIGTT